MVLGSRQLLVDIETGFVEIAASLRDKHSVETVQYLGAVKCWHTTDVGKDWERNSQVVDSRQVENYLRVAVVVDWAGLEAAESSTPSLSHWIHQGLNLAYH